MSEKNVKNKSERKSILFCVLSVVLTAIYMPFFMYSANCAEVNISELTMPLLLFPLGAVIFLFIIRLFFRSDAKSAVITVIMTILLENYSIVEKLIRTVFPDLKYWHILPLLIVITLHIGYLIYRKVPDKTAENIPLIVTIAFGALIAVNTVTAVPTAIQKMSSSSGKTAVNDIAVSDSTVNNNIYYFLLDEGASFKTLSTYYDYDAAEFRSFLEEMGFNISENSYNQSTDTHVILTDLLTLNYSVDSNMERAEMDNLKAEQILSHTMNSYSYKLQGVGNTAWLYIDSLTETNSSAASTTIDGEDILQITMKKTFLYPAFTRNINDTQRVILDTFSYYDEDVYSERGRFLMTYIESPHIPFVFNENGDSVSESHFADWSDEKYYLGQYKFIMKKTIQAIDNILENDPDCIIIIASDHGPRQNPE
ncbi:MAG: hypothetical protein J6K92_07765, partial [Oscillospiraceae bacterium]|nr:hypothetical protein [Oscillospiraceae bacterium]